MRDQLDHTTNADNTSTNIAKGTTDLRVKFISQDQSVSQSVSELVTKEDNDQTHVY